MLALGGLGLCQGRQAAAREAGARVLFDPADVQADLAQAKPSRAVPRPPERCPGTAAHGGRRRQRTGRKMAGR
jgi:hypothetical protein